MESTATFRAKRYMNEGATGQAQHPDEELKKEPNQALKEASSAQQHLTRSQEAVVSGKEKMILTPIEEI